MISFAIDHIRIIALSVVGSIVITTYHQTGMVVRGSYPTQNPPTPRQIHLVEIIRIFSNDNPNLYLYDNLRYLTHLVCLRDRYFCVIIRRS